ncbi:MAG: arginyltransferase [Pseudomonadales bacterium]
MSEAEQQRFFITPQHPCSYLEGYSATTLFLDPDAEVTPALYQLLSDNGFRRSGGHLYRPHCQACNACKASRVPVARFSPRRRHRRILRTNQDLRITVEPAHFNETHYGLFERYVAGRHRDGEMFPANEQQYRSFLLGAWSDTLFLCSYLDDRLVAVAVTDRQPDGLSAIYTFFEPELEARSLGAHSILTQIDHCQRWGLSYLYLGYWIAQSPKMAYKASYRPIEILSDNQWTTLT